MPVDPHANLELSAFDLSHTETLWAEDDAPVPDRERMESAYEIFAHKPYSHDDAILSVCIDDCVFQLMDTGLLVLGFPEGTEIRRPRRS